MSFLYGLCARHQHSAATAHEQHALLATENFAHTFRRARAHGSTAMRANCHQTSLPDHLARSLSHSREGEPADRSVIRSQGGASSRLAA